MEITFFFVTFIFDRRVITGPGGVSIFDKCRRRNNLDGFVLDKDRARHSGHYSRRHTDPRTARAIASPGFTSGEQCGEHRRQIERGGFSLANQTDKFVLNFSGGLGGLYIREHSRTFTSSACAAFSLFAALPRRGEYLDPRGQDAFRPRTIRGRGATMTSANIELCASRPRGSLKIYVHTFKTSVTNRAASDSRDVLTPSDSVPPGFDGGTVGGLHRYHAQRMSARTRQRSPFNFSG